MRPCTLFSVASLSLFWLACSAESSGSSGATSTRPNGTPSAELEASVARMQASGLQPQLVAATAALLKAPGKQWRVLDGWAVRAGELNYFNKWSAPDPQRAGRLPALEFDAAEHAVNVVEAIATDLGAHGIDFLVVPVPKRLQVYPDRLPGIESVPTDFAGIDEGYAGFVLELARRGVSVVDLLPRMARERYDRSGNDDERLFHDYDPHWTPRGIEIAAEEVARALASYDWFEPGPARAGRDFNVDKEVGEWRFSVEEELGALKQPVSLWFRHVRALDGTPAVSQSRTSPILLIGDSFPAHLVEAASDVGSLLYARIGQPVDMISIPQGGARSVWDAVARRRDNLAGKRVVIWLVTASVFANPKLAKVELFAH